MWSSERHSATLVSREREFKESFKRVIVTPAVNPHLFELLHFDIQSTGQKSRSVNTGLRPSQSSVLIQQSDSLCPLQFLPGAHPAATSPLSSLSTRPARGPAPPRGASPKKNALPRSIHEPQPCGLHKRQSFFRSYGSVLPTSLVCIVRYRPGELMRLIGTHSMHSDCQRPARIFKG